MKLVDTNIFLEYLLEQEKAEACLKAIEDLIEDEEDAFVSSFSLHSIEVILVRRNLIKELNNFLTALEDFPFIRVYSTTVKEEKEALELVSRVGLDFDDSIQYYIARKLKADLMTLDRHFDKVKGIKVIKP